jgi:hypothetical protein
MKILQTIGVIFLSFSILILLAGILNKLTNYLTATSNDYFSIALVSFSIFFGGVIFLLNTYE